ncbi:sulfatase-like hydrolase/transferase [Streptomyces sp. NPDC053431]|uniref:sulfatase-like hydrolase/transferase n=1 Tax=Streptomyces sp. NPDC053431 TaxID=3365703 RepID=UPI0037D05182
MALSGTRASEGNERPRKVLLVVADQLRADALGAYGAPAALTPHLDALAARGTLFEEHYSATAPCGPARTSLLTGLYQSSHGVRSNTTPADTSRPNLATALRGAGIPSHVVGYTDSVAEPYVGGVEGLLPGFRWHTHFNLNDHGLRGWLDVLRARGHPVPERPMDVFAPAAGTAHRARYGAADSDTAYVADRTIDCLTEHRDEPWLILATFLRPHPPWVAPAPYDTLHAPAAMAPPRRAPTREQHGAAHPFLLQWARRPGLDTVPESLTGEAVARARAVYAGLVTEVDHHVGRILAALAATGQAEDTLVVFTADHGDALGDHWTLGTGGFAATAYRVPLIVADPTRPPGPAGAAHGARRPGPRRIRRFTESVDVLPTLLDRLGAPPLPHLDGRSLGPLLDGAPDPWPRTHAVCEYDFHAALSGAQRDALGLTAGTCRLTVVRDAAHTYVEFPTLPPLLFDRVADPGELHDLAPDPARRRSLDASAARVRAHHRRAARRAAERTV